MKAIHTFLSPRWLLLCSRSLKCLVQDPFKKEKDSLFHMMYTLDTPQDSFCIYNLEIYISRSTSFLKSCPSLPCWFSGEAHSEQQSSRLHPGDRKRHIYTITWCSVSQDTMLYSNWMPEEQHFWVSDTVLESAGGNRGHHHLSDVFLKPLHLIPHFPHLLGLSLHLSHGGQFTILQTDRYLGCLTRCLGGGNKTKQKRGL